MGIQATIKGFSIILISLRRGLRSDSVAVPACLAFREWQRIARSQDPYQLPREARQLVMCLIPCPGFLDIDNFVIICINLSKTYIRCVHRGNQRFREIGVFGCLFFTGANMNAIETMDIFAASEFLKLSRWSLYQLTRKNKIPCHRPTGGRKLVFIRGELEIYLRGKNKG